MARAATAFERWLLAAVAGMLAVAGCTAGPPDRHQQADQVTHQIGALPAVVSATDVVADSVDAGLVYAEVHVRVADDATVDQVAAVASTYLDHLRDADYPVTAPSSTSSSKAARSSSATVANS